MTSNVITYRPESSLNTLANTATLLTNFDTNENSDSSSPTHMRDDSERNPPSINSPLIGIFGNPNISIQKPLATPMKHILPIHPHNVNSEDYTQSPLIPPLKLPFTSSIASIKQHDVLQFEDLHFYELLGKGAFSQVYRGELWAQEVAIKQLKFDDKKIHSKRYDNFKKEIEIMSRVRHPNLLSFLGIVLKHPNLCIVTEYCANGSLEDLLKKKRLNGKRYLTIAKEISRGLSWLHHKNIIHRDIKPSNILIDKTGTCKIADFGLSHIKESKGGKSLGVVGTPSYMSPEVMKNMNYNFKCDIYSFGVLLCEMLTGVYPYDSLSASTQTFSQAVCMGLRPELPKETHPMLKELIEKMWSSSPNDRPDISEVCNTLYTIEEDMITSSSSNYYIPFYFDWSEETEDLSSEITKLLEKNEIQEKQDALIHANIRIQNAEMLLSKERKEKELLSNSAQKVLNQRNKMKEQLSKKISILKKKKEEISVLKQSNREFNKTKRKISRHLKSPLQNSQKTPQKAPFSITPPLVPLSQPSDDSYIPKTPSFSSRKLTHVYITDKSTQSRILLPTKIFRRRRLKRFNHFPPISLSSPTSDQSFVRKIISDNNINQIKPIFARFPSSPTLLSIISKPSPLFPDIGASILKK